METTQEETTKPVQLLPTYDQEMLRLRQMTEYAKTTLGVDKVGR